MKTHLSRLLILLTVSSFNMAYGQSVSNPFQAGSGSGSVNLLSKAEALKVLTTAHKAKADSNHLERMLNSESNSFIIEYKVQVATQQSTEATPAAISAGLATRKNAHRTTKSRFIASFTAAELEQVRNFDALPMAHVRVFNRAALVKLLQHGDVKAIYENKAHQHSLVESLPLINQPAAIATGRSGAGTTVAVLDTGVDYTRSAFGSCTAPNTPSNTCRVIAALDTTTPDDGSLDAHGHGTNVAGIVAGIAPGTKIAAIDVFNGNFASAVDIISGINWAINNKSAYNIVSMNLSLGDSTRNTSECAASWATTPFANARAVGILPVVASGNDTFTNGISGPACAPGAVRVGAVYDGNLGAKSWSACTDGSTNADKVTCFSNSANFLTLLAPGSVITAAGYSSSGTSQAAPHVAGAIAVLRSQNAAPNDTLDQTINRLISTGNMVTDSRNSIVKPRLNLLAAVNTILPPRLQPPFPPVLLEILLIED